MFNFLKNKESRIVYMQQRDGTKLYYVERWGVFAYNRCWFQDSKETTSLKEARKMLKKIRDKEIVGYGIID